MPGSRRTPRACTGTNRITQHGTLSCREVLVTVVESVAEQSVRRALRAAAALRGDTDVAVDPDQVEVAFRSERHLRVRGEPVPGFAPLSRFWPAADGWVRTHANYPWHQDALLNVLGVPSAEPAAVAAAIAVWPAVALENAVYAADGLAVAVRSAEDWNLTSSASGEASVTTADWGDAPPRAARTRLRVLDLTRVVAGPVATRFLGALGHDVLRLDPLGRAELPLHQLDGLLGKRSALLDVATPAGMARLHELLGGADIVVHGYRPGALHRFGLSSAELADRYPGVVVVGLTAWGQAAGWQQRRGFDSLVQAATGIAMRHSPDGTQPGVLPCQLLDHAAGYLLAAAALEGVHRQRQSGGCPAASVSLVGVAEEVLQRPPLREGDIDPEPWLTRYGDVTVVQPPGSLSGQPLRWSGPPAAYGADPPAWT